MKLITFSWAKVQALLLLRRQTCKLTNCSRDKSFKFDLFARI